MIEILPLLKSLPIINAAWGIMEKTLNSFKTVEEDKWVHFRYPEESGLQKKISSEGYDLRWSLDNKVALRTEAEGYEIVKIKEGKKVYKIRMKDNPDNQTLLKKKR